MGGFRRRIRLKRARAGFSSGAVAPPVARLAGEISSRWQLAARWGHPRGNVTVLFTGGTGKTLAASWLATRLGPPLYRVDLAAIISKYVGETEKHLEEVFQQAEASGAILLFDEADALFGKRNGVQDLRDRYANLETGFLLQRIENHSGVVILTGNRHTAIDPAFLRRVYRVIHFPGRRPFPRH